jgi:hypothetical protein
MENSLPMNKNVVGIIIIIAAIGIVGFYAYPKMKLYFGPTPEVAPIRAVEPEESVKPAPKTP